ncbi:hypothetical protein AeMF1_001844 [Aphanomyces euteiches]|nr:hypothetical protein AeMF1_001844 [Aphanomyces euteiches]KAH9189856.1 hypothetical protein AeNC1_008165 [Aphanomyces euteiches]
MGHKLTTAGRPCYPPTATQGETRGGSNQANKTDEGDVDMARGQRLAVGNDSSSAKTDVAVDFQRSLHANPVMKYELNVGVTAAYYLRRVKELHGGSLGIGELVERARDRPCSWLPDVLAAIHKSGVVETINEESQVVWRAIVSDKSLFTTAIPQEGRLIWLIFSKRSTIGNLFDLNLVLATFAASNEDFQQWRNSVENSSMHVQAFLIQLKLLKVKKLSFEYVWTDYVRQVNATSDSLPDESLLLRFLADHPSIMLEIHTELDLLAKLSNVRVVLGPSSSFCQWWISVDVSPKSRVQARLVDLGVLFGTGTALAPFDWRIISVWHALRKYSSEFSMSVVELSNVDAAVEKFTANVLKKLVTQEICPSVEIFNMVKQMRPAEKDGKSNEAFFRQVLTKMKSNKRLHLVGPECRSVFKLSVLTDVRSVSQRYVGHALKALERRKMYNISEIENNIRQMPSNQRCGMPAEQFFQKVVAVMKEDKRLQYTKVQGKPFFTLSGGSTAATTAATSTLPSNAARTSSSTTSSSSSQSLPTRIPLDQLWIGKSTVSSTNGSDRSSGSWLDALAKKPSISSVPKTISSPPDTRNEPRQALPPQDLKTFQTSDNDAVTILKSREALQWTLNTDAAFQGIANSIVAIHFHIDSYSVAMATPLANYLVDIAAIGVESVAKLFLPCFQNLRVTKVIFDLYHSLAMLEKISPEVQLAGVFDLQLAMELKTSDVAMSFQKMLHVLPGRSLSEGSKSTDNLMEESQQNAINKAILLLNRYNQIDLDQAAWTQVQLASDARAKSALSLNGQRKFAFDQANQHTVVSLELIDATRPDDKYVSPSVVVEEDLSPLLSLLPPDLAAPLSAPRVTLSLSDIVLDKGCCPWATIAGSRLVLGDDSRVVTNQDLDAIVANVGGFGSDNRAGLEGQLHRVSAVRNRRNEIVGLTLRVGRHIPGLSALILDILHSDANVLFLGEPGCGKTTIVRDVARELSQSSTVCIVDTSNEIAGDGDVPHPCVGMARRIMVPSLDAQSSVMVECVQNHTPEVIVIDEIGRASEVEAARTCKQRGVRIIASAHGNLRKLLKNKPLRGLVGGVESVVMGDAMAQNLGNFQKKIAQRGGEPVFDVVIELEKRQYNAWCVVTNVGKAVDAILEGKKYQATVRTRSEDGFTTRDVGM